MKCVYTYKHTGTFDNTYSESERINIQARVLISAGSIILLLHYLVHVSLPFEQNPGCLVLFP